jgi:hypothetical protein
MKRSKKHELGLFMLIYQKVFQLIDRIIYIHLLYINIIQ